MRADAVACWRAGVAAVDPRRRVIDALRAAALPPAPVTLIATGKAAVAMAEGALEVLGDRCRDGLVVAPHAGTVVTAVGPLAVMTSSHPVPDAAGVAAATELLRRASAMPAAHVLIACLSGGSSALLAAPVPPLTLDDLQRTTRALLDAGADILALNTLRRHCTRFGGGSVLRAAAHVRRVIALALSDIIGDDLAAVASGPTVADPTTYADAAAVLSRFGAHVPSVVHAHVQRGVRGEVPETMKPGDPLLARATTTLVGNNADAVRGAAEHARALGYEVVIEPAPIVGDAAAAGARLAALVRSLPSRRVAFVAGGETTVEVCPGGKGGRSQHVALAAACALQGFPGVLLAAGTDGIDGPTDATGACVDEGTIARARAAGIDPEAALAATNSYPALDASGDLLRTGPTGTNVTDLVVALRDAC